MTPYTVSKEKLEELKRFDTPTITNVIATYPGREYCLGLYNPRGINWYTDERCKCVFPELGSYVGYAVTAIYGPPDASIPTVDISDILQAVAESPKPAVLVVQQKFPKKYRIKNGQAGGNFVTALKALGCIAFITNGPSRDISEIREIGGFQYMMSGTAAGHGVNRVYAVNVPVSVCQMDVSPRELIHMDEHGAVKFPAALVNEIIERANNLLKIEKSQQERMRNAKSPEEVIGIWKSKR
jgi:regulator of RNase E activity RraA